MGTNMSISYKKKYFQLEELFFLSYVYHSTTCYASFQICICSLNNTTTHPEYQ